MATLESKQFASGKTKDELAREAAAAEAQRTEVFRTHFERISIWSLYALATGLLLVGVAWLFHLLAPPCWQWLSEGQVDSLRGILTGGLIVGVLTDHFRKRLH